MAVAVVAQGAASALGVGRDGFDVGGAHASARAAWSSRPPAKPFGRVLDCDAERADRPRALLELGLVQVVSGLNENQPHWRGARLGVVVGTSSGGLPALERA